MSVQNTILAGVLVWLVLYAFVYYTLYASHDPSRTGGNNNNNNKPLKLSDTPFDKQKQQQNSKPGAESLSNTVDLHDIKSSAIFNKAASNFHSSLNSKYITLNPFLSSYCSNLIQSQNTIKNIATIIITYKETSSPSSSSSATGTSTSKQELMQTLESILKYSNGFLKRIIIVDDYNPDTIQNWPEWTSSSSSLIVNAYKSNVITILRTEKSLGKAGAKNYGAIAAVKDLPISSSSNSNNNFLLSQLKTNNNDNNILIFLEAFAIVSFNWISPLYDTLHNHPKAIVYPMIDVMDINQQRLYRSSNVVAGFDWSLQSRWEDLEIENKAIEALFGKGSGGDANSIETSSSSSGSSRLLGKTARSKLVGLTGGGGGSSGNKGISSGGIVDNDTVTTSPATPSIFALTVDYYHEIGPFLSSLSPPTTRASGTSGSSVDMDITEFSIRVWSCGGIILRQPCSRVAMPYINFNTFNTDNTKIISLDKRKYDIDILALSLANTWMTLQQTEYVFISRFLSFMPYKIDIPIDSKSPTESNKILSKIKNQCSSFQWYINEVYPGLITDSDELVSQYGEYLSSNYEETLLQPLLNQYNQHTTTTSSSNSNGNGNSKDSSNNGKDSSSHGYDEDVIAVLKGRASRPEEVKVFQSFQKFIPPVAIDASLLINNRNNNGNNHHHLTIKMPVKTPQQVEDERHEEHADRVRELLLCQDEDEETIRLKLKQKLEEGEKNHHHQNAEQLLEGEGGGGDIQDEYSCKNRAGIDLTGCENENNRYYMIFGCPKTCQLCGTDGLLCADFYEKKCKAWKDEGKCESDSENMHRHCRLTCGKCTRAVGKKILVLESSALVIPSLPVIESHDPPVVPLTPVVPVLPVVPLLPVVEEGDMFVNPYVAQRKLADGLLPDPVVDNPCAVKGQPDGQLLDRVTVVGPSAHEYNPNKIRVFCSVYTIASKHTTNVKATVETWGKKCDGFLAFSTENDAELPALKLTHEGPESWDNMWQKARSIWKYIAKHYINDFDYFLLGGDDMFYIVENLYYYLNTEHDIVTQNAAGKSLFLGRRFFPPKQNVFNSGGAGYILNRAAVLLLLENIDTPKCFPHQVGFWEDVNVANCLRVATTKSTSSTTTIDNSSSDTTAVDASTLPYDTRDSQKRERFHPFTPGHHLQYRVSKNSPDWYANYNPELTIGVDCCSDHSISFHYCPAPTLLSLHAYLYHCKK